MGYPLALQLVIISVVYLITDALLYPAAKLGVSFSPAGLLTPFHIGASEQLRKLNIINEKTALAGSSGGALAALSAGLSLSSEVLLASSANIAKRCRDEGPRNVLRKALEAEFKSALPMDCCDLLKSRLAPCFLAYTELTHCMKPHYICDFKDRDDVIEVLSASCNVPYYFDGNNVRVGVRGSYGIDGVFSTGLNRVGCPPTGATHLEISVSPYSATKLVFCPRASEPDGSNCEYALITPHLLTAKDWPFSLYDVLQMSLNAPEAKPDKKVRISDAEIDDVYRTLYDAGMAAVRVWYERFVSMKEGAEMLRTEV